MAFTRARQLAPSAAYPPAFACRLQRPRHCLPMRRSSSGFASPDVLPAHGRQANWSGTIDDDRSLAHRRASWICPPLTVPPEARPRGAPVTRSIDASSDRKPTGRYGSSGRSRSNVHPIGSVRRIDRLPGAERRQRCHGISVNAALCPQLLLTARPEGLLSGAGPPVPGTRRTRPDALRCSRG